MTALADAGRFNGAVLVARGDTVLLSKGYGMANFEFSVPATPKTVFPIGSNTKQLTAAAILKLEEQGRLDIKDPVKRYVSDAPHWKDIRIHHLLNHTSGIPSEGAYIPTDAADIKLPELMRRIIALPLAFKPGTETAYSNNGYITLSYIVERASDLTYEEYLRRNIFLPLGMTETGQDNARDVFPNRASGYTTMAGRHIRYEPNNIHNRHGAGALHSTTEDLFRWVKAFHTPGAILSPRSSELMTENAYGVVKGELKGRTLVGHGGRAVGFLSYTLCYPAEGAIIIFLSNHDRTPMAKLPLDLSAIVFGEPYDLPQKIERRSLPLTPEAAEEFTGNYALVWEESWTYNVFFEDGNLFYNSVFPPETVELFFEGNDTYFVTPESADSFVFTRNDRGVVDGFVMFTLEGVHDKAVILP